MSRSWILAFVLPLAAAALAADTPAAPRYFKPAEVDAARARGETGSMLIEDAEYKVLASRRGDCNEHAVLLAALARAAGIPARIIAGAVYANDGFYYHAWNELWLGAWVSADAVFDQLPADATHVKLIEGGLEQQMALMGIIGQLAFAVVEEKPE